MYFNELEPKLELYLDSLKSKNYSNETIKNYNTAITKFIAYGLTEEVSVIDPDSINQIIENYQTHLIKLFYYKIWLLQFFTIHI